MTIVPFLNKLNQYILNPLIGLIFAIAFLVFFWGIVQFINSQTAVDGEREKGKQKIMYGLLGMFIMFSAYGIIRLLLDSFGLPWPRYLGR
jgi:hypothetical protein